MTGRPTEEGGYWVRDLDTGSTGLVEVSRAVAGGPLVVEEIGDDEVFPVDHPYWDGREWERIPPMGETSRLNARQHELLRMLRPLVQAIDRLGMPRHDEANFKDMTECVTLTWRDSTEDIHAGNLIYACKLCRDATERGIS